MIHTLNLWDTNLLLWINGLNSVFFDGFMWLFSEKLTWLPLYLSVLYVVVKRWKMDTLWVVLALVLCIVIADQVSSGLIKKLVERPRPTHVEALKGLVHIVNGYEGGRFGFVSSHAANSFGFALLSSLLFKRKSYTWAIFAWATLTAYSRMYLGVHYPFDVLGGIVVGVLSALVCYWALKKYRSQVFLSPENESNAVILNTLIPIAVLGLSVVGIIIYSLVV